MEIGSIAQSLYSDNVNKTLYHYTSLAGLLGTLESKSLCASEIRFLNDAAEMKHMVHLLDNEISRRLGKKGYKSSVLGQFKDWMSHRITDGHMLFCASLTANGNLLSQWRGYCPPNKGVSIGFHPTTITHCSMTQEFLVGKCIYDRIRQDNITKRIIDNIENIALKRKKKRNVSKHHTKQSFYYIFEGIEADLLRIAALLKSPAFQEEDEWRVVSPVFPDYIEPPIKYRDGASMLIPFLEFQLLQNGSSTMDIQHVFLGPTSNNNLSMTSLSRFLTKKGAIPKEGITACQLSYRQL